MNYLVDSASGHEEKRLIRLQRHTVGPAPQPGYQGSTKKLPKKSIFRCRGTLRQPQSERNPPLVRYGSTRGEPTELGFKKVSKGYFRQPSTA